MGLPKFTKEFRDPNKDLNVVRNSGPIPWNTAKEMIRQYRDNRNHIPINSGQGITRLDGFRFKKSDILSLFDNNNNVTEVFICFGVTQDTVSTTLTPIPDDDQFFTTILLGLEIQNNNPNIDTSLAVDFCDPCPTACPVNLISILYQDNS